ncbi:MAG: RNA polymerase sigma factor [Muribaculaceae bacterium]|nr:RNA polymerase sigma factor [Muribaculaceae bacterium]
MNRKGYIRLLTETMESQKQRLFRYACYRLGNQQDAEDILQNVYLKLLESIEYRKHPENLRAYIFRSVVNACSDFMKRESNISKIATCDTLEIAEDPSNFEEEAVMINRLVENMPENLRDYVRLRIYAEMTFDEVAETMEVSSTTAKRRFYEGLEYLRAKLNMI